jgi:uncharacterized lipoprotein YmbA
MKRCPALFAIAVLLLTAGCGSTPTRFYTLTPVSAERPSHPAAGHDLTLGVGPVELPKSLDRPQIVTRRGQNEFDLGEFDQWAEPLQENVTQVLAENLSVLVPAQRVAVYPWDRSKEIDYQVLVKVLRFDRSAGGDAVFKARWSLKSPTNENELLARETSYAKRPAGEDYKATVEAMNFVLGEFSRDVAAAVRGLRNESP